MIDCERTSELLPWWLNGTLDPEERRQVEVHLSGCERCRRDLEEARFAARVFAEHVPAGDLVAYAFGEPTALDRGLLERHLAACADCAAELELTRASRRLQDESIALVPVLEAASVSTAVPGRAGRGGWRAAALAAGLAGLVAAGGWFAATQEARSLEARLAAALERSAPPPAQEPQEPPPAPAPAGEDRLRALEKENRRLREERAALAARERQAAERIAGFERQPAAGLNTFVQDLYSSETVVRGNELEPTSIPRAAGLVTFILHPKGEAGREPLEVEIADARGRAVWTAGGLVRNPTDDYTLTVSRELLPAGRYAVHLYARQDGRRVRVDSFPLEIR